MGVKPTPTNFKTFTFDGENSRSYGVYITGEGVFNAPERNVEMVEIPGRNGAFALDKGNFNNIEVTYPAGIFADTETDFAEAVSDLRNFLCSRVGYVRLEDDYNPNEYRLAVYKSGLDVEHDFLIAGEFELVFECKPQRFLKSGETPITIGEWGETTTYEGAIAQFENPNGYLAVKSLTADIEPLQDLHGYDKPWVGGAGKNKLPDTRVQGDTTINGVTFTTNSDGSVTINGTATSTVFYDVIRINAPFTLPQGQYVVSGLTGSSAIIVIGDAQTNIAIGNTYNLQTFTLSADTNAFAFIQIPNGATVNNIKAYPMIRLASVSDATFEPWENLCPITGWTGCEVDVSGVNVWDEEWELGALTNNGVNYPGDSQIRSKNYIPVLPSTIYHLHFPVWCPVYWFDGDKNLIERIVNYGTDYNLTSPSNARYMRFFTSGSTITTYNHDISINYPSTYTTYHAHNPNSAVYNITWQTEAGTVYGGTVDVVSGVLTVTHGSMDMGNATWTASGSSQTGIYRMATAISGAKLPANNDTKFEGICSAYEVVTANNTYSTVQGVSISTGGYVIIYDSNYNTSSSPSAFKTAMTGQTIVYELATPTTYQLTGEQIDLLIGHNNVWNNIADTSIEVGNDPNYVINPTRFEARPQLQVNGYGTLNVNGKSITVENVELGTVLISPNAVEVVDFPQFIVANGDPMYPEGTNWAESYMNVAAKVGYEIVGVPYKTIEGASQYTYHSKLYSRSAFSPVAGTAVSSATTFTHTFEVKQIGSNTIEQAVYSWKFRIRYDGGTKITTSVEDTSWSGDGVGKIFVKAHEILICPVIADSTASALGNPLYLDSEIGEAYRLENGHFFSMNNYVQMPAELPVMVVGINDITFDNTFNYVHIIPRWWKV